MALRDANADAVRTIAIAFATKLERHAEKYDREAQLTRRSYPGDIGREASAADHRKACDYREIATLVREAAKELP